ncbi:MAG: TrkH family potassium uptake protein [Gammaproteobacteria bacterium]|nr:TrkH family potassium uptake protein [Gammaproteobacteria bacterium]
MQLLAVLRILGLLLMIFSLALMPPLGVSFAYHDGAHEAFIMAFLILFGMGLTLFLPLVKYRRELRLRDGFLVVVLFWVVLGLAGALPLVLSTQPLISVTDAMFESMSGLTTTGATVIQGIDWLPESIRFYRQQLQWMGGMGIIVLAVAILPMLGIGGMQLYRAEMPGPVKDKLTPRITETAKALWYIYLGLTVVCGVAYWLAGMSVFDAVGHAFSTVAIGGFSTHDASIGHYDSAAIEAIAVVFMVIAGGNFALHFRAWHHMSITGYLHDSEFRTFVTLLGLITVITTAYLYLTGTYPGLLQNLRHGLFQSVSIATTTGFTTTGYHEWPTFLPVLLLFASFVGACAGSTGGGLKVIRVLLLFKQGAREIQRLIHPNAVIHIKVGGKTMPDRVIDAVWGFFAAYVATFSILMLALMATGLDQRTAFSAMAASINNLGPGLGDVSLHYGDISATAKWILAFAMLVGRLEVFTLLVILTPAFWRR